MSREHLATLAEKIGASEALIERSAQARATASGSTADAVLTEWTGGEAAPVAATPATPPETPPAPAPESPPEEIAETATAEPEPELEPIAASSEEAPVPPAEVSPAPAVDLEPEPVPAGSLSALLLSALAVFAVMFVAAVIAPAAGSNAETLDAVQTIELSDAAVEGRDVYLAEGCALCHTQQVRPVVTDGDLGIVTLSESPLIPGIQRIGPDLSHVGSREPTNEAGWLVAYLEDPHELRSGSDHPSFSYLSADDRDNLVSYLLESK